MRRRILISLLASAAFALLLLAGSPLWLGMALRHLGGEWGFAFSRYERIGYAGFALHDITYERPEVRVTVERGEGLTPILWLWRHWRGGEVKLTLADWAVEVRRTADGRRGPAREWGWVRLSALLTRIVDRLDSWIPRVEIGAGTVQWPGGRLALSAATLEKRELVVENLSYLGVTSGLTAAWSDSADRLRLALRAAGGGTLELESRGTDVTGELSLWGLKAPVKAAFAPQGWLPREASLLASSWEIPAERLKLAELYRLVRSDARLEWRGGGFSVDVDARGDPRPERSAPPLQLNLHARGTPGELAIEVLKLSVPGVRAELSAPVIVERSGRVREGGAKFSLDMDLDRQPWVDARGHASGEATVASGMNEPFEATFRFAARDVAVRGIALSEVAVEGLFEWPRVQLSEVIVAGSEGDRLAGRGGWDFRTASMFETELEGVLGRALLERWIPDQVGFETVAVRARVAGTWPELEHQGEADAPHLKLRGAPPLAARIHWHGRGDSVEQFHAVLQAGEGRVTAGGTADRSQMELREMTVTDREGVALELERPAVLRWRPSLAIEGLRLAGPGGDLNVSASVARRSVGSIDVRARNLSSARFEAFIPLGGPSWRIGQLGLSGEWNEGPMVFAVDIEGAVNLGGGRVVAFDATCRGEPSGVRIDALRAAESGSAVLSAKGRVPVTVHPGAAEMLRVDQAGALELEARAVPHADFWSKVAAAGGVELREPEAVLDVGGTWERPEGQLSLKAARLLFDPLRARRELPAVESLDLQLSATRDWIELKTLTLALEGQPLRGQGRLPVPREGWPGLLRDPWGVLRQEGTLRLEVPAADVTPFARLLPAILAPQGRVEADLTYDRGKLGGRLLLHDAASRPLGPLGVLQEINAEARLSGHTVHLVSVSARSGGQPVTLGGTVELPGDGAPRFDLALTGKNLPFVRQTGLLLRGDVDLKLQSPRQSGPPRITGRVLLRDSLFLQDVRAFLPRGGGGPARRPPYFSIEAAPLNTWALAVEVGGDAFMRLRTPVFNGVASAHLRLGGTLGEPRATGEVSIDEGRIRMPFASFEVSQGAVRLTEANPFEPMVYVRGSSRRFGHDLAMEIEGPAGSPNIAFTSSPPLDSEQVLLMVMTGAVPGNEVTYSGTQRVARLGAFVGQSLLGTLGADSSGADRLGLAAGEKISRQGRETYEIEYRLSDRWTAIGEYNEFDEYTAGLKWRIHPRDPAVPGQGAAPEGGSDVPR